MKIPLNIIVLSIPRQIKVTSSNWKYNNSVEGMRMAYKCDSVSTALEESGTIDIIKKKINPSLLWNVTHHSN